MTYPIGIIGVGNMGGAMAANLLSQGWPVHICDIADSKTKSLADLGAVNHKTPAELTPHVSLLIVCVVDGAQTRDVLFGSQGAAPHLRQNQTVMLCPTIAPEDIEFCANKLWEFGIETMDAPMSGGPARARDGSMSLMLACNDAVYQKHQTLISALSNQVFRISEHAGDGAKTKLVNNLLASINLAGAAEVMGLAEKMGLDLSTTLNVIEHSSGQSWIGSDRMRRAIANDYEPRAHTTLLAKDSKLAVQSASLLSYPTPMGQVAMATFAHAVEHGYADLDDASLFNLMQK